MVSEPRHEMQLTATYPSGAEEWSCLECGRRMMITWQPWKKVVLEPGDLHAAHGGSKGLLKLGPLHIGLENENGPSAATDPSLEDTYLAPWAKWLDKKDWDDPWNEEL